MLIIWVIQEEGAYLSNSFVSLVRDINLCFFIWIETLGLFTRLLADYDLQDRRMVQRLLNDDCEAGVVFLDQLPGIF